MFMLIPKVHLGKEERKKYLPTCPSDSPGMELLNEEAFTVQ